MSKGSATGAAAKHALHHACQKSGLPLPLSWPALQPEPYRLAFREFGTTLGVQASAAAINDWLRLNLIPRVARRNRFAAMSELGRPAACRATHPPNRHSPLPPQVNPAAGSHWAGRVDALHEFWAQHLFTRDAGATRIALLLLSWM